MSAKKSPINKPKLSQVLLELKQEYLATLPGKLQLLTKLTQEEDWAQLSEEYHKLKGTGKTYGYPEISLVSERLEILALQKEGPRRRLFNDALLLFEKMHQAYLKKESFPLEQDSFARSLLALKLK